MSRFINLGVAIVNADYIIRVETNNNGSAQIYMSDGTMFHCDDFSACDLYGCGHIICLVPCTGVDAVYNSFGKVQHIPVHTLAVNAAGEVYPLHQTDGMGDSADYGQFLGLCERG